MLDGKAATPLYVQLIQELEAKISEGILTPEARLPSESELSKQYGVRAGGRMLENRIVVPDERIARLLGLEPGSQTVFISRVRCADGEPVVIEHNYFPLSYSFLLGETFHDNSLFQYLRDKREVTVDGSEKWFELCRAGVKEARLLKVKKGGALLRIRSVAYNIQGKPIYAGVQLVKGECFSFYVYERGKK